jgi:membrane protease YdiL (CAAX protease family)
MESSAPPQPPAGYLPVSNWRYLDVVGAFLAGILGSLIVTIVVFAVEADPLDPLPFSLIFAGQAAGSFAVISWLSRRRGSGSLAADVGLVVKPGDWWGVPAGMALQVVIALVTLPLITLLFPDGAPEQSVSQIAGTSETLIEQLFVIVAVAVAAPIIEEMIFRGMLLSVLRRSFGPTLSVVASAAVFSLVHLVDQDAVAAIPGLFLLGLVLGWVALRRGDLSLSIALHSGINLLAAIALLWGDDLLRWSEQQLDQIEGMIRLLPF